MIQVKWTKDIDSRIYSDAVNIRYEVFIEEQKFPEGSDIDELEDLTEHLVLYDEEKPLATARIFELEKNVYRIERVAVRTSERKRGLGSTLIHVIEEKMEEKGAEEIVLKSEGIAIEFYKKFGYQGTGDIFLEYGEPHQQMSKLL